jgi:hypothetical protein
MNSHIIVSILFCTLSCEPAEIRVWDGDSIRLGLTREVALRFIHLADDWIADCRGRSRVCHTVSMRGLRLNLHQIRQVCRFSGRLKADVGRATKRQFTAKRGSLLHRSCQLRRSTVPKIFMKGSGANEKHDIHKCCVALVQNEYSRSARKSVAFQSMGSRYTLMAAAVTYMNATPTRKPDRTGGDNQDGPRPPLLRRKKALTSTITWRMAPAPTPRARADHWEP